MPKAAAPVPAPAGASKSDISRFRTWRLWNKPLSSTVNQDHEDAGVMMIPASQNIYSGIYAKHLVYAEKTISLRLPASATSQQVLYAATTRPPNGSCLEVGTAYITQPSADPNAVKTTPALYVYDFCAPGGGNFVRGPIPGPSATDGILIDQSFVGKYAQAKVQNLPAYEIEIFTKDYPITANSTWYATIFNHQTGKWETLFSDRGMADDNRGWSIFETYYQSGQCSEGLPILGADQISLLNALSGRWELLNSSMPLLTLSVDQGGTQNNNCFVADPTGPASYKLLPDSPDYYMWSVNTLSAP
ncbi:hypothetical protein HDF10_002442 [Edaphobacter lichenicola]|uniref:Uncharacterized protein n=1 Tax=Tunturiibacter lichenicola TaxID=2051959 RepID=A0A7W8N4F5_9BACT|nr:hypothetical protein [Edaphobacter lichenicola]